MDAPIDRATLGGDGSPVAAANPPAGRSRSSAGSLLDRRSPSGRDLALIDVLAVGLAIGMAFVLRYDGLDGVARGMTFGPVVGLPLLVRPLLNRHFGLYERVWHYASVADFLQVLAAAVAGTVVVVGILYGIMAPFGVVSLAGLPTSFWALEALLSLLLIAGSRLCLRVMNDRHVSRKVAESTSAPAVTLLFGAGEAGAALAKSAMREPRAGVRPAGFLDDNPALRGQKIAGLPVFGTLDDLGRAVRRTKAQQLLITMPAAGGDAIRRVTKASAEAGLQVRTVPPLHDLLDGTVDAYRVRRIQVEDLLRRPPATDRIPGVKEMIADRTIMITGGGGSIGSELARQVWSLRPAYLVLVDRGESALHEIQIELQDRRHDQPGCRLSAHLANVASRPVIERLIAQVQPNLIFHAAAYKHVPLMEAHPSDAVQVNIGGTLAVIEAALACGVERLVLVSSDKAVHPSSVMGATKRVGEWLVADAAARSGFAYVSVRFGNVLGSNGSVVPIFQNQLERGEPLTITHPEMMRYFMTIPEAVWLILDAAALGEAGQTFVLDMGQPVSILDLARDLSRLAGRDPDTVPIEITGLRPGEKLTEALVERTERLHPTVSPKVRLVSARRPPSDMLARVRALLVRASGEHDDEIRKELFALVNDEPPDGASPDTTPADYVPDEVVPPEGRGTVSARHRAGRLTPPPASPMVARDR